MLEIPPGFDVVYNNLLEHFLINKLIIVDLIKYTDHPEANNVNLVLKITFGNVEQSECIDLCSKSPVVL